MKNLFQNQKYSLDDGIFDFNIDNSTTKIIKKFYEETPFPNYNYSDDKVSILEIGNGNYFMKNLKKYWDFFNQLSSQMNPIHKIIGLPILMLAYLIAATFMKTVNDH